VEPQMSRKQLYTDRLGERLDSFTRRVWISVETPDEIPVGLPVQVTITAETEPDGSSGRAEGATSQSGAVH
jgi:hypothetical protein